jgi:capsid protein
LRNPEILDDPGQKIQANDVFHVFEFRRAQQQHGDPILAPVIERAFQDERLVNTELKAAISTASVGLGIESEFHMDSQTEENSQGEDGQGIVEIPAGSVFRGHPGDKLVPMTNPRPSQLIAPFRASMRGDIAAACRVSQWWLDKDPSRANYSSMRMDQTMGKRCHAQLKEVAGYSAKWAYRLALPWILLRLGVPLPANAADRRRIFRCKTRPDQPEYVDPQKDVAASSDAIEKNLSTFDLECSARGKNYREIFEQRKVEKDLMKSLGIAPPEEIPVQQVAKPKTENV